MAEKIVRESSLSMPVHYCSSRFKDSVQLRQRLLRQAERMAPAFAERTPDGTVVLGIVEPQKAKDLPRWALAVARRAGIGVDDYRLDVVRRRVELGPEALRRVAPRLPWPAFEVEEYPTSDALEVERMPLNRAALERAGAAIGGT